MPNTSSAKLLSCTSLMAISSSVVTETLEDSPAATVFGRRPGAGKGLSSGPSAYAAELTEGY